MNKNLIDYLSKFITEKRFETFLKVINERTDYISIVLEDIYQAQNASAVLRSCDCFGIQNVHIIENENEYNINPTVALGSSQWLNLHRYNSKEQNTIDTINSLKKQGYRIIATTPHTDNVNLEEFDIEKGKFALMFGSEQPGLSDIAMEHADEFLKIPMYGFTESFNISVSAAIILNTLTDRLREKNNLNWLLSEDEKEDVLLNWYKNSINNSEGIIRTYISNNKSNL